MLTLISLRNGNEFKRRYTSEFFFYVKRFGRQRERAKPHCAVAAAARWERVDFELERIQTSLPLGQKRLQHHVKAETVRPNFVTKPQIVRESGHKNGEQQDDSGVGRVEVSARQQQKQARQDT